MKKNRKITIFLLMVSVMTCFNLLVSHLLTEKLISGWRFSSTILNIVYTQNTGAAFSILQNSTKFLVLISFAAVIAIIYYIIKHLESLFIKEFIFVSFLLSGILGNLYERVVFGYVRDFFDLNFINFPIFNISDIFINIGVFGIIIIILFTTKPIKLP